MCAEKKGVARNLYQAAVTDTGKQPLRDSSPDRVQAAFDRSGLGSPALGKYIGVSDETILNVKKTTVNTQVPTVVMLALELGDDFGVPWLQKLLSEPTYRAALFTAALPLGRQQSVIEFIEWQYEQATKNGEDGTKVLNISGPDSFGTRNGPPELKGAPPYNADLTERVLGDEVTEKRARKMSRRRPPQPPNSGQNKQGKQGGKK